jgi:hypothetical protein
MPYDLLDLLDRPGGCSGSRPQDSMARSPGGGGADVLFRIWFGADDDEMVAARVERDEVRGHRQRLANSAALSFNESQVVLLHELSSGGHACLS